MDVAIDRASFAEPALWDRVDPAPRERRRDALPASSAPAASPPSRYGAERPRWGSFGVVAALHAVALVALVRLDVIDIAPARKPPLVVTLLEPEAMTPPPPPPAETRPVAPSKAEIVTPPAIVPVAAPASPPLVSTPEPAPPAPVESAAPPAPAAAAVAAPVTAPDGFAGSLKNPAPRYPIEARRKRQQGTVRLRVVITPDGRVKEIAVARSSGVESLDEAALTAVSRWKFRPGTQAGVPVEAVGYLPIPFVLKD